MNTWKLLPVLLIVCLVPMIPVQAAQLKPGFERDELIAMLRLSGNQFDSNFYYSPIAMPKGYARVYRSAVCGFDNRWDLWIRSDSVAVICVRGSTPEAGSWLGNAYAAMLPATGSVHLSDSLDFFYSLSRDPRAAVHAGWLTSLGFLWQSLSTRIDSLYAAGIHEIFITGHSQGGAIATLLTAKLLLMQEEGTLPAGLHFKTYCTACPKPGNLYFAYGFEKMTQWGTYFNVINTADWVSQVPISIQAEGDFAKVSPFSSVDELSRTQPFPTGSAIRIIYRRMEKPVDRASRRLRRYLGKRTGHVVEDYLPGYESGHYDSGLYYVRTGRTIVMVPDEAYYKEYPDEVNSPEDLFVHHFIRPYLWLAERDSVWEL